MKSRSSLLRCATIAFVGCSILMSAFAHASAAPAPVLKNVPAPWIGYLLIVVLMGIIVSISLLPSKRSHQD